MTVLKLGSLNSQALAIEPSSTATRNASTLQERSVSVQDRQDTVSAQCLGADTISTRFSMDTSLQKSFKLMVCIERD